MTHTTGNPLAQIIEQQGFAILDGGLATTLESRGYDLDDELWSARLLLEDPAAIRQVHSDYLAAGADCVITASYQASLEGFAKRGLDDAEAAARMRAAVDLAIQAREAFDAAQDDSSMRPKPLVAAGIGPYGAYLADGSEYTGHYDLDDAGLYAFHQERWRILAESPADLLACETIPSLREAKVLLSLLADTPGRWAWFSFSCGDGIHLHDGSRLIDAARLCAKAPQVAAIGVNCTAPRHILSLIGELLQVTTGPIIVYPNRGETYDAVLKTWQAGESGSSWADGVHAWHAAGARAIGGCCRVGTEEIALTRRILSESACER